MDFRHLRYFVCLAEELHFGRAAQRLGISQPPLSQQIKALEDRLRVPLFERTSRRVRLTEAGRLYLPEARQALAQVERATFVAQQAHRGELGRLRLGFTASAPFVRRVADALYDFRQSHPEVELALEELGRDEQIAKLENDDLDIGIVRAFEPPPLPLGMISECLLEEEMLLAVRKDHPLARRDADPDIADLAGVPLLLYGAANGAGFNEHFLALCAQAGFRPKIAMEVGSFATLLGLAAAGFGATILSQSLARLQVDNLVLRHLASPVTSRLWLVRKHQLSPVAQAFNNLMLGKARHSVAKI
ncbi:MAG: LysR family transcriptional regulator [Novosphingobium sp.]|nr:LysR family transcriptional regulator [Novosphingobium sp.]